MDGISSTKQWPSDCFIYFHVAHMGEASERIFNEILDRMEAFFPPGWKKNLVLSHVGLGKDQACPNIPPATWVRSGVITRYEFPTLFLLWAHAQRAPTIKILYLHTKGASREPSQKWNHWRDYLLWGVVENWELCLERINEEEDMVGVDWAPGIDLEKWGVTNPRTNGFWAGNFWWAKASYIMTLPDPLTLPIGNRYYAEGWVGLGENFKTASLQDSADGDPKKMGKRQCITPTWTRDRFQIRPKYFHMI